MPSDINNESLLHGFTPYATEQKQRYDDASLWHNQPLWSLLTQAVNGQAEKVAVRDMDSTLSYRELLKQADEVAQGLINQGFQSGDRLVMQLTNSTPFALTFFALQRAGLVPIMALPAHGLTEIDHFVAVSGAKGYIGEGVAGSDMAQALRQNHAQLTQTYVLNHPQSPRPLPNQVNERLFTPPTVDPDHPALFLVSGGTTGLPKLIPRSHNDYLLNIHQCAAAGELSEHDVYLAVLPAAHNFTLGCPGILGTLYQGGQVVFSDQASPDYCFELIEQHRISFTALVPSVAQLWTEATEWEDTELSSLRVMQVGGSKLAYSDARAIQAAFPATLQQVFGMAEGLIACTRLKDSAHIIASTQGRAVSDWDEIRIVDTQGNEVPQGVEGELLTRGPYTLRGYYRAPDHNARSFTHDGFYRSGDKVRIDANQSLTITGRIKDVVNRAGECIAADEIEEHLLSHPQVAQVAVVAVPDAYLGERIGVALVGRGRPLTLQCLRQFLHTKNVATYKMPDELHLVDSLPKTAVGKVDKKAVPGPCGNPWVLSA
ncbi:(2,3-dihydroxybenzoyl)adenylate synthase [Vibrio ostreicida]|uniref:(2,3-dihydroxybenzoyl)adenylate synthase n=1 Tax=Vibrio ostreicida TaxID=526588 RepID=UPI003B58C02E